MPTKYCPACKETKDVSEFRKDRRKKDGLAYRCKWCVDTGNTLGKPSDKERLLAKAERQGEHLIWTASKTNNEGREYGVIHYEGRLQGAHVVSYKVFVGPVEPEYVVHHRCRITLCIEPTHLEKVTQEQNMVYARKDKCIYGHYYAEVSKYGGQCAECHRERERERRKGLQ